MAEFNLDELDGPSAAGPAPGEFNLDELDAAPSAEFNLDELDRGAPTPQPSFHPTEDFTNVESGGSADTPNATSMRTTPEPTGTPVPSDFYSSLKPKEPQNIWDVIKHEAFRDPKMELIKENPALAAGLLTGEAPMFAQMGASLLGGAIGRYSKGQDIFTMGSPIPFKGEPGIWQDLEMPILPNVALGGAKGVAKVVSSSLARKASPDIVAALREATNDITKGWQNLGDVEQTGAAPKEFLKKNQAQAAIDTTKDIIGSPIERGAKSKVQELKDVAKRIGAYVSGRNRINEYLDRRGKEIFYQPKEGILGKLGRVEEIPLQDREDMKLFLEGHKTLDQISPLAAERAPMLKKLYDDFGDLGDQFGVFHPGAPRVTSRYGTPEPAYTGPNIPQDPKEAQQFIEDMTKLSHEGKRTTGFHERVEHKYFEPSVHVADAKAGFDLYKKYAPEIYSSHYAFGAPGDYTSLAKAVGTFGARTLAKGASIAKSTAHFVEERAPGATVAEGGTKAFGRDVNELLNRAASLDLAPHDRATLESLTDSVKQIYHTGEYNPAAALAGKSVGTTLLPLSWWNQFNQTAWNIAKPGLQDFTEGLVRYAGDPDFRNLIQTSGGRGSSMEHLFNELKGKTGFLEDAVSLAKEKLPERASRAVDLWAGRAGESAVGRGASNLSAWLPENLVGKSIGWSESMLRGPLGAGHYVHGENLIERGLGAAETGRFTRGLSRELAEAGIDQKDLADPELMRSPLTLRNTGRNLTNRYQLMAGDPGHSSAKIIGNPWGRVLAQFKSFPLGAARLFKNDVLDPLYRGAINRDMSEFQLGAERLARLIPAAAASTGVAMTGKQILQGKGPADWAYDELPSQAFRDVVGMPADLATKLYSGTDPETGKWSAWRGAGAAAASLAPPAVGVFNRPTPARLSFLAANALMPKLGSAATMFSPYLEHREEKTLTPMEQYRKQQKKESPLAQLRRQQEARKRAGR